MLKSLLVALCVAVILGCSCQNDDYKLNTKTDDQGGDKEWKTFISPLSTKTQSPQERAMKRLERSN
ncbi:hypothetical protein [Pantoea ananatis]|uniref:hypothetical protein n=1 Tax=Pantoea ananas TaxID=553 RepID=UPI000A948D86|nr:hypothetical protein [Pantoea ananatis]MCW0332933.1 hypothetical protein [Pantoea ananatis]